MIQDRTRDPAAIRAFLKDLGALSRKHRIAVGGCGCCGSPFLLPVSGRGGRYETADPPDWADRLVFVQGRSPR